MWQRARRQSAALDGIVSRCETLAGLAALFLVGSGASDQVDELSDLDLLLLAAPKRFAAVWASRTILSEGAIWSADSPQSKAEGPGGHKWLTPELVFVEVLIGEPGQFRLAEPFRLLVGDRSTLDLVPRRPPIDRMLEFHPDPLPVARAYDEFKEAVRRAIRSSTTR